MKAVEVPLGSLRARLSLVQKAVHGAEKRVDVPHRRRRRRQQQWLRLCGVLAAHVSAAPSPKLRL